MSFEEWYETYERDGGELLLFNAIDMEVAFTAGVQAERERSARIAETFQSDNKALVIGYGLLAAAIRRQG